MAFSEGTGDVYNMNIDAKMVEKMLAQAAVAKVKKSEEIGTKATWSMGDQAKLAGEVFAEAFGIDADEAEQVFQMVYNHSGTSQKLGKAFEKTGHFQRESREKKVMSGFEAMIAKLGAGKE